MTQERSRQFDPWLFRKIERERAHAREQRRREMQHRAEEQLRLCFCRWRGVEVYLFGSLLRSRAFAPSSDIDIAVMGLPKDEYFTALGELEQRLQTDHIDLIELERCPFAESIRTQGQRIQ